jgi:hypothetical protein
VRAARAHPFLHPLPLVAEGSMITKAIQKDLVLIRVNPETYERTLAQVLRGECGPLM